MIGRQRNLFDTSTTQYMPPYYHLERDPIWCGMLLYNFLMVAHEGAILVANSWTFTLPTAYLYNSLRQTGTLQCQWPDMERLVTMHGAENLFVGDLPTTFEKSMKSFGLAMGISPSLLAGNQRQRSSAYSCSKHRKSLGMLAPTLWKFKSSICDGVSRGALGPSDVKNFMRQKILKEAGDQGDSFNWAIDALSILRLLPAVILAEASEVGFSHFEMHVICWKLLRQLHDALVGSLPGWLELYRDDRSLPSVVFWLLSELAEQERVATALGSDAQSASTHILSKAREGFEDFILEEDDDAEESN